MSNADFKTRAIVFQAVVAVPQGAEIRGLTVFIEVPEDSQRSADGYLLGLLQTPFILVQLSYTAGAEPYHLNTSFIREVSNIAYSPSEIFKKGYERQLQEEQDQPGGERG